MTAMATLLSDFTLADPQERPSNEALAVNVPLPVVVAVIDMVPAATLAQ